MVRIGTIILFYIFFRSLSAEILDIPYCQKDIKIDGEIKEWNKFGHFTFTDTLKSRHGSATKDLKAVYWEDADFNLITQPKSRNSVQVYACWNMQTLNFAFLVEDDHLHSPVRLIKEYPKIYLNDGIEVYIDTKNDSRNRMDINDYQFVIDLSGQHLVFRGERYLLNVDSIAVPKDFGQNILFKYIVSRVDEHNSSEALDHGYIVEMSIPFASIGMEPSENSLLKLDLCNNDLDKDIPESAAGDKKYALGWSFNWSGESDFGFPDHWKLVTLSGNPSLLETVIEKYKAYWFLSLNLSIIISLVIIILLILRMARLQRMPKAVDISIETNESAQPSENQQIIRLAKNHIVKYKSNALNSENLARELGISLRKLQRITREELDCTPTNFIYLVKLSLAADFIKKGQGNISQAAYEFGFNDPAYFSKLFKKHFGLSPKEFKDLKK